MGDIINNLVNSVTGGTEKAYIEITDGRGCEVKVEENKAAKQNASSGTGSFSLTSVAGNLSEAVEGTLDQALAMAENLQSKLLDQFGLGRKFEVHFNPSSLSIQAMGGGKYAKNNYAEGESGMNFDSIAPRIQVSMRLIFDKAGSAKLKDETIQPEVEGFIAALRNPMTRHITFSWGTMTYEGILNYLDVSYTMFSVRGNPIRAEVAMGIICVDDRLAKDNMGQWKKYYEKAFGNSGLSGAIASMSGSSSATKLKGLFS